MPKVENTDGKNQDKNSGLHHTDNEIFYSHLY